MTEKGKYDEILNCVYESENRSLPAFFDTIFGWLSKQSPESLNSNDGISLEHILSQSVSKWRRKAAVTANTSQVAVVNTPNVPEAIVEVECTTDGNTEIKQTNETKNADASKKNDEENTGGSKAKYYWSQTVEELEIRIPVPSYILKGKELDVVMESVKLKVGLKGGPTLLEGPLHKPINCSESLWDLTPKKYVTLHLAKQESAWWGTGSAVPGTEGAVEGATEAERPYHSLPPEERADISRVMFDAHQKAAGKPTSDTLKMEKMLRDAWDAEGSPFKGQPFDPSKVNLGPQGL